MPPESDNLKGGTALLTAINVVCAAIGAAQGVFIVRTLGPNLFGIAAVLVAIASITTNLVDVRITDLVSRIYFDARSRTAADRATAIRVGLAFSLVGGTLIALLSRAA